MKVNDLVRDKSREYLDGNLPLYMEIIAGGSVSTHFGNRNSITINFQYDCP